jgi:transposase-like protein
LTEHRGFGTRAKTVLTDVGPVEVRVPRDTASTFEPQIVKKRQRCLTGVDEMVLSLSSKGLTHGEISAHLAEVSKQLLRVVSSDRHVIAIEWGFHGSISEIARRASAAETSSSASTGVW